jgi:hypothetical protein
MNLYHIYHKIKVYKYKSVNLTAIFHSSNFQYTQHFYENKKSGVLTVTNIMIHFLAYNTVWSGRQIPTI